MSYKYTKDNVFKGFIKDPPLPRNDPRVYPHVQQYFEDEHKKKILADKSKNMHIMQRKWFSTGCAVEEIGRFGYLGTMADPVNLSILLWKVHDLLAFDQCISNNDNYGPTRYLPDGTPLFNSRFVIASFVEGQLRMGAGRALEEYLGFKRLVPFFGNTDQYGSASRIGIYGICCTRYVVPQAFEEDTLVFPPSTPGAGANSLVPHKPVAKAAKVMEEAVAY